MNTIDKSLVPVESKGIFSKIVKFVRNLFIKNNAKLIINKNNENSNRDDNSFFKSIKFEEDPDKRILLKIQDDLEKKGINEKNVINLTKDLSEIQKQKLENLYIAQIKEYEISLENYKNKIISIRKRLVKNT